MDWLAEVLDLEINTERSITFCPVKATVDRETITTDSRNVQVTLTGIVVQRRFTRRVIQIGCRSRANDRRVTRNSVRR